MVDMKLGSLVASIVVDGGHRPHYGARDAINGKVILEYVDEYIHTHLDLISLFPSRHRSNRKH